MKLDTKVQHVRQAGRGSLSDTEKVLEELVRPTGPTKLAAIDVGSLPNPADYLNHVVLCTNGAEGDPILAFSDGSDWLRSDTGAAVSDS